MAGFSSPEPRISKTIAAIKNGPPGKAGRPSYFSSQNVFLPSVGYFSEFLTNPDISEKPSIRRLRAFGVQELVKFEKFHGRPGWTLTSNALDHSNFLLFFSHLNDFPADTRSTAPTSRPAIKEIQPPPGSSAPHRRW